MKKGNFLNIFETAIEAGNDILVQVKLPGNKKNEIIINSNLDLKNKMNYYDNTYDENMKHKHAPVEIVDVSCFSIKECLAGDMFHIDLNI